MAVHRPLVRQGESGKGKVPQAWVRTIPFKSGQLLPLLARVPAPSHPNDRKHDRADVPDRR